jgi:nitronate monooxygenase
VGLPGRAIKNTYLSEVELGIKKPFTCPWKCLNTCDYTTAPYCIAMALISAQKGHLRHGFAFAGSNAYRVDKIVSVQELMDELAVDFESAMSIQ